MFDTLEKFLQSKADFPPETLKEITSCFKSLTTVRNEILIDYYHVCKNYYFINKGCIRLFTTNKDGTENSRFFAFEGSFATALPSFIDQKPAQEYLQTIEKSELFIFREKTSILLLKDFQILLKYI